MLHRLKKKTTFNKMRDLRLYIGSIGEESPFVYTTVIWVRRNLNGKGECINKYN